MARIVTGATKLTSRQLLYDDTGWETLQTRRSNHKLIKFHEMFHKDAPDYLNSLVPPQISEPINITPGYQTTQCILTVGLFIIKIISYRPQLSFGMIYQMISD